MVRVPPAKQVLWGALAVPAAVILVRLLGGEHPAELIAPSGLWSARLIIAALMLGPLTELFRGNHALRWLLRHRRAFGVAGFAYGLLHLLFYLIDMASVADMLAELPAPGIWTAWLAFLFLLPPALASSDAAMRLLGRMWKKVQRFAYPAAVLTLFHWVLVHDGTAEALLHFAPLALLQLARIARMFTLRPIERTSA